MRTWLSGFSVRVLAVSIAAGEITVERDADGDVLLFPVRSSSSTARIFNVARTKTPIMVPATAVEALAIPWREE